MTIGTHMRNLSTSPSGRSLQICVSPANNQASAWWLKQTAGNHNNGHNEPINDAAPPLKPSQSLNRKKKTVNKRGLNAPLTDSHLTDLVINKCMTVRVCTYYVYVICTCNIRIKYEYNLYAKQLLSSPGVALLKKGKQKHLPTRIQVFSVSKVYLRCVKSS